MLTEDQDQCVPIELPLIGGPGDGKVLLRYSRPLPVVAFLTNKYQEHKYHWNQSGRHYRYVGRVANETSAG